MVRRLLTFAAALGLLVPTYAMPCCGCCETLVDEHATSVEDCAACAHCCSLEQATTSASCCDSPEGCGGSDCQCEDRSAQVIATQIVPSDTRDPLPNFHGTECCTTCVPVLLASVAAPASIVDGLLQPDGLRLHSQLCVWRN